MRRSGGLQTRRAARCMTQVFYKLGQKGRVVETDPERVKLTNLYLGAGEYSIFGALLQISPSHDS